MRQGGHAVTAEIGWKIIGFYSNISPKTNPLVIPTAVTA